jgi:two-component system sensor histidine kinase CiaH
MFESARLKLTAWYLLIIMFISILFSVAFYDTATVELERIINRMQFRQEFPNTDIPEMPSLSHGPTQPTLQDLEKSRNKLLMNLLIINGSIFVFAGAAGYFLAGRTLRPIKLMIDEQNQFISSASHELRTPIATMRAEMEGSLLEKHLSDAQSRTLITSSLEELDELQELSNNLLRIAQVHGMHDEQIKEEVSLAACIAAAHKKVLPLAKKKAITIQTNSNDAKIMGEKGRLTEVFVILFDNAIKYSQNKSKIIVTSKVLRNTVSVSVADEGMGIAAKDLEFIFDRFYRADKSRSEDGYGLGLAIAKRIIEAHNGTISVASEEKNGTTFTMTFPQSNA